MIKKISTRDYIRNVETLKKHGYEVRPQMSHRRKDFYLSVDVYNMYENKFLGNFSTPRNALDFFHDIIY